MQEIAIASLLIGAFLILLGWMFIAKPDTMWRFQMWQNRLKGLQSERNETWEGGLRLGAAINFTLGVVCLFIFAGIECDQCQKHHSQKWVQAIHVRCSRNDLTLVNETKEKLRVEIRNFGATESGILDFDSIANNGSIGGASKNALLAQVPIQLSEQSFDLGPYEPKSINFSIPEESFCRPAMNFGLNVDLLKGPCDALVFELNYFDPGESIPFFSIYRSCRL